MIKEFFIKQLIKRKLKGVPQEMQDRIAGALDKDPKFFEMLSKEIEAEVKQGKNETAAAMGAMRKHQQRLRELLS